MKNQLLKRLTALSLALCLGFGCAGCTASAAGPDPTDAFTDIGSHWAKSAIRYCLENKYMAGVGDGLFKPGGTVTRAQVVQVLYRMAGSPAVTEPSEPDGSEPDTWEPDASDSEADAPGSGGVEPANREDGALMPEPSQPDSSEPDASQPGTADPDPARPLMPFTDMQGHWAEKAVAWAYNAGIVSGIGAESFAPNAAIIREQAALMFKKYREYSLGETITLEGSYISRYKDRGLVSSWAVSAMNWAVQSGVMSGSGPDTLSPKGRCTRGQLAQIIKNYYEPRSTPGVPGGPEEDEPAAPDINAVNSPLVSYVRMSPNHSGRRKHGIDTISIHCMAEDWTVEKCGEVFADPNRQASSNYGIGSDGRIALYVDERNRSWCTSSAENDNRAVTIEVANIGFEPNWPVSEQAYAALIDLVTDICWRNGIKRLLWQGDKDLIGQVDKQNMTVHRWFANKSCPGEFLYSRHGDIAARVNQRLAALETAAALDQAVTMTRALNSERSGQ